MQFHIFSTLLYIAVSGLAFVFLEHLFGRKIAMISMVIFVVHPIHVEAVAWISGKPYLLIAFYVLLATLFFIKFIEDQKWENLRPVWCLILGFLTDNPRPFSFFVIIVLYLILNKVDIRKNKLFKFWPYILILLGITAYVVLANIVQE